MWEPMEGVSVEIQPITVDNGLEHLFTIESSTDPKEVSRAVAAIIMTTLKNSIPDATEEELSQIGVNHLASLMDVIRDVNNLSEDKSNAALDKIKAMQEAVSNQ